jgi:hypothetical protein
MSNVDEARKAEVPQTEEFANRLRSLARSKSGELWADQEVIDKLLTYKSLCASQHEVIKGYEEQEAAMVAAIKRAMPILESHEYRTNEDMGALVACQAALEKAGVEL